LTIGRYTQLALERFVDDVSIIAVEKCFIDKLPSLLTPNRVLELHPDKIKNLVGESEETTIARTKVVEKLRTLERGLQDIKSFQGHRNASSAAPGTTLTVPVPELRDQSRIDTFPRTPEVGEEVDEASFTGSELREPLPPVSQFMLNRRVFET
jgi:hypothetical protein